MKVWEVLGFNDPEAAVLELADLVGKHESNSQDVLFVCGVDKSDLHEVCSPSDLRKFRCASGFKLPVRNPDARAFLSGLLLLRSSGLDRTEVCVFDEGWSAAGRLQPEAVLGRLVNLLHWLDGFPFHPSSPGFIQRYIALVESVDFGEFSVELRKELKRYLAFYEAFVTCFYKGVGGTYREALADSFSVGILKTWSKVLSTPELIFGHESGELKDRVESIRVLYSRCALRGNALRPDVGSESWPRLIAATAGWFSRVALQYRRWGMTNAGLMALVRVAEMAMVAVLLEQGVVELSSSHGGVERRGRVTKGAGEYVSYFEEGVCGLEKGDLEFRRTWVATARRILAVRNNSRLGHGLAELSSGAFDEVYLDLRWCLKGLLSSELRDEYDLSFSATKGVAPVQVLSDIHYQMVDNALEPLV